MNSVSFVRLFSALLASVCLVRSYAEDIIITKPGDPSKAIPISLSGFTGEAQSVLRYDLEAVGCEVVGSDNAQYIISGSNNGSVEGRVTDRATKAVVLPLSRYENSSTRSQAHAFANDIIERLTGKKGIFLTKIAFKGQSGSKTEIYVSDFDGANPIQITKDNALVAAPCWVPGHRALYYTSYMSGYPDIWFHDLSNGERRAIAKYPGLNTSAAVSPNGRRMAMILSRGGSPDLYVADANGGNLKQLTKTREDESSPCWSPDGQTICYVSAVSGTPALYLISAEGGTPRRLRTVGANKPTEPDWSPDGKWIAFTSMFREFQINMVPAQGGDVIPLVEGEDPSWAPNSRTLIISRHSKGKRVLSLLDVPTKRVKDVPQSLGGCSQPSWTR